jgi:hypothetical protein
LNVCIARRTDGQSKRNIPELLREYEEFGGLVVNWRVFGSSGHKTRPQNASTLEAYTACIPDSSNSQNRLVKSIVNVPHVKGISRDVHHVLYKPGFFAVNELKQRRAGARSEPVSVTRFVLHHYCVKSKEEFMQKQARGSGNGRSKGMRFWSTIEKQSTGTCLDGVAVGRDISNSAADRNSR